MEFSRIDKVFALNFETRSLDGKKRRMKHDDFYNRLHISFPKPMSSFSALSKLSWPSWLELA